MPDQDLPIDRDFFDLLVCPESRAPLKWVGGRLVSTDGTTRRAYGFLPEIGGPDLCIERSVVLSPAEWTAAMASPGPVGAGPDAVRTRLAAAAAATDSRPA